MDFHILMDDYHQRFESAKRSRTSSMDISNFDNPHRTFYSSPSSNSELYPNRLSHTDSNNFVMLPLAQKQERPVAAPMDLDDDLIENMLVGLKENKKICLPSITIDSHHATSNPIPIPQREQRKMSFDSIPSSPTMEDFEPSNNTSSISSLHSSPTPLADLSHMTGSSNSSMSQSAFAQDKTRDTRWKEHFQELTDFKREYGHTNVTQTKSKTLAEWVKNQRRLRKAGKLAQSRINKLDEIGFEWDRSYLFKNKREPSSSSTPSSSYGSTPKDAEHSSSNSRKRKPKAIYDPSSDGDLDYDS